MTESTNLFAPDPEWRKQKPNLHNWITPVLRLAKAISDAELTPSVLTVSLHQHEHAEGKFHDCFAVTTITGDVVHVFIDPAAEVFSMRCPMCGCPHGADQEDLRFVSEERVRAEHLRAQTEYFLDDLRNNRIDKIRLQVVEAPELTRHPEFLKWCALHAEEIDSSLTWNQAVDIAVNEQLTKDAFLTPQCEWETEAWGPHDGCAEFMSEPEMIPCDSPASRIYEYENGMDHTYRKMSLCEEHFQKISEVDDE